MVIRWFAFSCFSASSTTGFCTRIFSKLNILFQNQNFMFRFLLPFIFLCPDAIFLTLSYSPNYSFYVFYSLDFFFLPFSTISSSKSIPCISHDIVLISAKEIKQLSDFNGNIYMYIYISHLDCCKYLKDMQVISAILDQV